MRARGRPYPRDESAFLRISEESGRYPEDWPGGPDGSQVWFRIAAWLMTPDRQLEPDLNRFQVLVSDAGDTRIERYGD